MICRRSTQICVAIPRLLSDVCTYQNKEVLYMNIEYNVTGSERKRLVSAISKITDTKAKYPFH